MNAQFVVSDIFVHERERQYHRVKNGEKNKQSETKFVVTRKKTKRSNSFSDVFFPPIKDMDG